MGIINILCLRLIIVQEYFAELGLWHQAHLTKSVPGGAPLTTVNTRDGFGSLLLRGILGIEP